MPKNLSYANNSRSVLHIYSKPGASLKLVCPKAALIVTQKPAQCLIKRLLKNKSLLVLYCRRCCFHDSQSYVQQVEMNLIAWDVSLAHKVG